MPKFATHIVIKVYDDLVDFCEEIKEGAIISNNLKSNIRECLNSEEGYFPLFGNTPDNWMPIYWESTFLNPMLKDLNFKCVSTQFRDFVLHHLRDVLHREFDEPRSYKFSSSWCSNDSNIEIHEGMNITIYKLLWSYDQIIK